MNPANFSMDNIQAAAKQIADFKPTTLKLSNGLKVVVDKLPGEKFDEGLMRFIGQIVPLFDDADNLTPDVVIQALTTDIPEAIAFFIENGTDLSGDKISGLLFDERVLLVAAVVTLTFVEAAGVRCFLAGLPGVVQGVSDGQLPEPTIEPKQKEN